MMNALQRIFAPRLASPLYRERMRSNLRATISVALLALVLAFVVNDSFGARVAFGAIALFLVWLAFTSRGDMTSARVLVPVAAFALISYLTLEGRGLQDPAAPAFLIVLVVARALGSGTSSVIYLIAVMIAMAVAWSLEMAGHIVNPAPSDFSVLVNFYIVALTVTASIWLLAKNIEDDRDSAYKALTDLEDHQKALADKERQYRLVADNAQDFIWTANPDLEYTYCSPACERILGYDVDELIGGSILFGVQPEDRHEIFVQRLRETLEGELASEDNKHAAFPEIEIRHKNGSRVWVDAHVSTLRDDDGRLIGIMGTTRDISDRIRAQSHAEEVANQLRQAQKIDSIGQLAGGIAHDFNNMLVAIQGYSDLASRHKATPPEVRRYVQEIKRASVKAKNLTMQLLTFSRRTSMDRHPLSMNSLLAEVQGMLSRLIPATVNVKLELDEELPGLLGDSGQIEQLIVNLCVNARDAMASGGVLTLRSSLVSLSEADARDFPRAAAGRYVRLSVIDTGVGMEPELLERVFDPFFTTKKEGEGTGLGLSVVHGIVVEHGGFVTLESSVGLGTSVHVHFPAMDSRSQVAELPEVEEDPSSGSETILVVEDEEQVRNLVTLILSQSGYTVLTANDGMAGWELYLAQRDKISAIICDVVMPNMGGRQLLRLVRELDEAVPFVFMSGYVGGSNPQSFADRYQVEFLQKPFSAANLQQKVREVLDRRDRIGPERRRVLAVDDNESVLHLLELDVEELGHDIRTAASGEDAIRICDANAFDIIFMDIQMNPMDGIEATREIRQRGHADVQIIGLTAHVTSEEERRCLDAGMDEVITKPIRYDKLTTVLGGKRKVDEGLDPRAQQAPVFDLDVSLHLASNRPDVAAEMFSILIEQLQEDQQAISDAWQAGDIELFARQVHKLNGATRYCGVPALNASIDALETRVKSGSESEVAVGLDDVNARVEELMAWSKSNPDPFGIKPAGAFTA